MTAVIAICELTDNFGPRLVDDLGETDALITKFHQAAHLCDVDPSDQLRLTQIYSNATVEEARHIIQSLAKISSAQEEQDCYSPERTLKREATWRLLLEQNLFDYQSTYYCNEINTLRQIADSLSQAVTHLTGKYLLSSTLSQQ